MSYCEYCIVLTAITRKGSLSAENRCNFYCDIFHGYLVKAVDAEGELRSNYNLKKRLLILQ